MAKLNILKEIIVASAIGVALLSGYGIAMANGSMAKELPLAEQPIISKDAVDDYKHGLISRDSARTRIEMQLNQLQNMNNISDWEYKEDENEYLITLSNGTLFAYVLN